jgi:hypothetical protein
VCEADGDRAGLMGRAGGGQAERWPGAYGVGGSESTSRSLIGFSELNDNMIKGLMVLLEIS